MLDNKYLSIYAWLSTVRISHISDLNYRTWRGAMNINDNRWILIKSIGERANRQNNAWDMYNDD